MSQDVGLIGAEVKFAKFRNADLWWERSPSGPLGHRGIPQLPRTPAVPIG